MSSAPKKKARAKKSSYSELWIKKDGTKISLEEMTDAHLVNCIKMLERNAVHLHRTLLQEAFACLSMFRGEMAIDAVESDIAALADDGPESLLPDIYYDMISELKKRGKSYL